MNEGYGFEPDAKNSWQGHRIDEERLNKIKEGLLSLRTLCSIHSNNEEPEDAMLLESMGDVLESLERTFIHHFEIRTGHIVSPKSDEPWD